MNLLVSIDAKVEGASKDLLGGKGYGLWLMRQAGIRVPPAYIIVPEACRRYIADPEGMMREVRESFIPAIKAGLIEEFGFLPLVSVRSGARDSMPGMMDTILNVGLDSANAAQWASRLGESCVRDSFARLVEMFGNVVYGIERKKFEGKSLEERLLFFKLEAGNEFPDADRQLELAIEAVFKSWNNERAKTYRKLNGIPDDLGTAAIVQAMVFGNYNERSGTGVAFSRNYSTGANEILGDWLLNAQGEDVVAGIRIPQSLAEMREVLPEPAAELVEVIGKLEKLYRDMVDVEFTVQDGILYILQSRVGKRTSQAAIKIAVDMVNEGLISVDEALERVSLRQFLAAMRPSINPSWAEANPPHAKGLPASNGAAKGVAVFSSAAAVASKEPCILVVEETTPDDIAGMHAAQGILTSTGGATSHAAVVARGIDRVCVVGCTALEKSGSKWVLNGSVSRIIKEGDLLTIDGSTGAVWVGSDVPPEGGSSDGSIKAFLSMIEKRFGFYRTVLSPEEMDGAEKLLVATYHLDRDCPDNLEEALAELLLAVAGREAVIDLRPFSAFASEAESMLNGMFNANDCNAVGRKVNMLSLHKRVGPLANASVLGLGLKPAEKASLVEAGFPVVPHVHNRASLVGASGLVTADFDALLSAMSRESIASYAKRRNLVSLNIVDRVEPEHLGRSARFALSPVQMAQSLLPRKA